MSWADTRRQLQRVVAKQGATNVANKIPVHPATVYRLLRGETKQPLRVVQAAVERFVKENEDKQP